MKKWRGVPLEQRECKHGHIGLYFINSKGHPECRGCIHLAHARAYRKKNPIPKPRLGPPRTDPYERLMKRVVKQPNGCWLAKSSKGWYSQVSFGFRNNLMGHRVVYERLKGKIPEGMHLDHLCRVKNCVNPDHLEPVTIKENVLRGVGLSAQNAKKTHCIRGHPFNEDNTLYKMRNGRLIRSCRACQQAWWKTENERMKIYRLLRRELKRTMKPEESI